jgi:hypothetical protein
MILTEIPEHCLESLKEACKKLKLKFNQGAKTYRWYGRFMNDYDGADAAHKLGIDPKDYGKCSHSISVPGSDYDIGLIKNPKTGNYRLIYDFFGHNGKTIEKVVGHSCELLTNEQGLIQAETRAKKNKLKTKRVKLNDGTIRLDIY